MELLVIKAVVDKQIFCEEDIPELYSCIQMYAKAKNEYICMRWKSILVMFRRDNLSQEEYIVLLSKNFFEQWNNADDFTTILDTFRYKISVVFKYSKNMEVFVKQSLLTALEMGEDSEKGVHNDILNENSSNRKQNPDKLKAKFLFLLRNKIDKFISMIIGCSFNWISGEASLPIDNVIDESQVLDIISSPSLLDPSETSAGFDQVPFKIILTAFLNHFNSLFKNVGMNEIERFQKKNEILDMFSNVFKRMNPNKYPGFAFAWVDLISSKSFMPEMLSSSTEYNTLERWFKMQELFNELFEFLKDNIYENCPVTPSLVKLFEGTLKLCLVVLHDYPEFLCYYYFEFINHLPLYQTVNLRNMILAAYPNGMRLPDPSAEIKDFPESKNILVRDRQTLLQDYIEESEYFSFKADLDKYLGKN